MKTACKIRMWLSLLFGVPKDDRDWACYFVISCFVALVKNSQIIHCQRNEKMKTEILFNASFYVINIKIKYTLKEAKDFLVYFSTFPDPAYSYEWNRFNKEIFIGESVTFSDNVNECVSQMQPTISGRLFWV